jgi:hypothetical protein
MAEPDLPPGSSLHRQAGSGRGARRWSVTVHGGQSACPVTGVHADREPSQAHSQILNVHRQDLRPPSGRLRRRRSRQFAPGSIPLNCSAALNSPAAPTCGRCGCLRPGVLIEGKRCQLAWQRCLCRVGLCPLAPALQRVTDRLHPVQAVAEDGRVFAVLGEGRCDTRLGAARRQCRACRWHGLTAALPGKA